jgi:hypothetical protein
MAWSSLLSVILMASLGLQDWSEIEHLTRDKIAQLVFNYRGLKQDERR